jgi:LysR family transcriptional regulator, flagellar master operon regulator
MDTDLLRTFIEVSKSRHFGRAAETLYLTQSAVSFRIRQLEQQLGVTLFDRHRNNIQLTSAGERLFPYAEAILQTLGRAKQEMGQQGEVQRQLAVGAPLFCWEMGLQEWIDPWFEQAASPLLKYEFGNREQLCRQLLERTLDLAILGEPSKIDEVSVRPLAEYHLILVSRQSGLSLGQLQQQPLIMIENHAHFTSTNLPAELQSRTPVLLTPSLRQAEQHLKQHGGIAYLPHPVVATALKQGALHMVESAPHLPRTLYLAYRSNTTQQESLDGLLNSNWRIGQKSARSAPMVSR